MIKKRYYHIIPDASVVLQWMEKLSWERHLLQTQPCTFPTHCRRLATIFHPFSTFSENRAQDITESIEIQILISILEKGYYISDSKSPVDKQHQS